MSCRAEAQVAPHTEEILREPVRRRQALRVPDPFAPSHLTLAVPDDSP